MKWAYSIKNKLMASGILLILCLLVLLSNYLDQNHTENVKGSISTLYEDRLVVEGYILRMTSSVYQIREIVKSDVSKEDKNNRVDDLIIAIKEINEAFKKTKFTTLETKKANELQGVLNLLPESLPDSNAGLQQTDRLLLLLSELSAIQLEESKNIMHQAEALYASNKVYSHLAFAIILVILVVLQILVFSSSSLIPKNPINSSNLN